MTNVPTKAITPVGLNHVVFNVRDMDESHAFWTEILGFKQVGELKPRPDRPNPPRMRFYSYDHGDGRMSHHDLALVENPSLPAPPAEWGMFGAPVAINHIAIAMPDRESFTAKLEDDLDEIAEGHAHESGGEGSIPVAVLVLGAESHDGDRPAVEIVRASDDLGAAFGHAFAAVAPLAHRFDHGLHRFRVAGVDGHGERTDVAGSHVNGIAQHGILAQRRMERNRFGPRAGGSTLRSPSALRSG